MFSRKKNQKYKSSFFYMMQNKQEKILAILQDYDNKIRSAIAKIASLKASLIQTPSNRLFDQMEEIKKEEDVLSNLYRYRPRMYNGKLVYIE
jgi:hypothetical protein